MLPEPTRFKRELQGPPRPPTDFRRVNRTVDEIRVDCVECNLRLAEFG